MKIHKLHDELINKIAAGEVVERPSSVIKELIENSIDAHATSIIIELKNGGIDLIRIEDNGDGMSKEDALLSLERHTTSKLSSFEDFNSLSTMGFRGEALSSIASVSRFTLETVEQESGHATKIQIQNGENHVSETSRAVGTKISVGDLFYNVPARKKFLKTAATEYNSCLDVIYAHCLIQPSITWKVLHNDLVILNAPKVTRQIERIEQVLGEELSSQFFEISIEGGISIKGFIGSPKTFRASKKHQFTYVNSRPVQDYMISKAVSDAYVSVAQEKYYPAYVLNIVLPQNQVDINVHPRKTEVKFLESNEIFKLIRSSVKNILVQQNVLTSADLIHSFARKSYEPVGGSGFIFKPHNNVNVSGSSFIHSSIQTPTHETSKAALQFNEAVSSHVMYEQPFSEQSTQIGEWKLIGQVHKSYLIVESQNGFYVVDQHAAAERLNYERYTKEYNDTHKKQQRLLVPITIELDHRQVTILDATSNILQEIGFDIESFGNMTIVVHAVPQDLVKADIVTLVKGMIDDFDREHVDHLHDLEDKQHIVIKYAACRGAIMFNDQLSKEEQLQLLKDIQELPGDKHTCCHGRPFMKEFSNNELEKLFHRH